MEKFSSIGIQGDLLDCIFQQSVVHDGSTSSAKPISAEVPQGSILEVTRGIDNMKHWTDGGLEVAREIDNMKHWTDG